MDLPCRGSGKASGLRAAKLHLLTLLGISPDSDWYRDEFPLRPATNVIIGPNKKYAFALKQPRARQLQDYLEVVHSALSGAIQYAFEGSRARAAHLPYYSIQEIEFYWEFDSDAPIDWVLSLRERLAENGFAYGEDLYETTHPALEVRGQSPCLKLRLTDNIRVKVYAKTNRRVRFEVTLKGAAINSAAGRRTHDSADGLVSMIPALAQEAVTRNRTALEPVFDEDEPVGRTGDMRTWYTTKPTVVTSKSHVSHVVGDAGWEGYAANALEASDQVRSYAKNDHLGFEIFYLWNGSKRRYVPDFLIKSQQGRMLVLEIKGQRSDQNDAKHAALEEWIAAVNENGRFGSWTWAVAYDPNEVDDIVAGL